MLLNNKKAVSTLHDVGVDVTWQHQFWTSSRRWLQLTLTKVKDRMKTMVESFILKFIL